MRLRKAIHIAVAVSMVMAVCLFIGPALASQSNEMAGQSHKGSKMTTDQLRAWYDQQEAELRTGLAEVRRKFPAAERSNIRNEAQAAGIRAYNEANRRLPLIITPTSVPSAQADVANAELMDKLTQQYYAAICKKRGCTMSELRWIIAEPYNKDLEGH